MAIVTIDTDNFFIF